MDRRTEAAQLETWAMMLERAHISGQPWMQGMTDAERCVVDGLRRQAARLREELAA